MIDREQAREEIQQLAWTIRKAAKSAGSYEETGLTTRGDEYDREALGAISRIEELLIEYW